MSIVERAVAKNEALRSRRSEENKRESTATAVEEIPSGAPALGADGDVVAPLPGSKESADAETLAKPGIQIPFEELASHGYLSPSFPRSRIAEEYRGIKRPLLKNIIATGDLSVAQANLVMVTSALQGDGKTFSSINLALSIAMEQDKTVLYVDADVVRANAGRTLGVPQGTPGLIDILKGGELSVADVILHTDMPKLRILPAGNASPHATELLASEDMHHLMLELSERYSDRVIVFDSPPLLQTTEASVLASFMGQIVFVAAADKTPQRSVAEAIEQIGEDKLVGLLLNRVSRRRFKLLGMDAYGYGYGYGYGYSRDRGTDGAAISEMSEGH
jgi:protein-tyrosine kinase